MLVLWMFLGSLAAGITFLFAFRGILQNAGLQRANYRGVIVPTSAGIIFVPSFLAMWIAALIYHIAEIDEWLGHETVAGHLSLRPGMLTMLILVIGMCFLGLLDDVAGSPGARGFKGHFSEALKGRFTTGFMKAILGFIVALAALLQGFIYEDAISFQQYGKWVLGAAVIALTANLFNLLDLAPGRALKVFFPALAICIGLAVRYKPYGVTIHHQPISYYVVPAMCVAAVALVLFPGDLREKFMMGDAGSNVIGAVVGLGLVFGTSFWWQIGVLAVLIILNILSEKFSFSRVIASNRVLNWLDSVGRKG